MVVYFVLTMLSLVTNALVIASIASTSFLVFTAPHVERSRSRYIVGGYTVSFITGGLCYLLMRQCAESMPLFSLHFDELYGAIAIGLSIFIMVVTDLEHPPASAASLSMVINTWDVWSITVTYIAIFILIISRSLLRKHLINLV